MMTDSQPKSDQKSVNVGHLLLCRVKCADDQSVEELDKIDCVRLESIRSGGANRAVHRCILDIGSEIFAQDVKKLRTSSESEWSNTIRLDMSIDIMDIIVEYLYTREPIRVTPSLTVQLYAAAKRYGLTEITEQVKVYCQSNIEICLHQDVLWTTSNKASDIDAFTDVFEMLSLDSATKFTLMQCAQQWSTGDAEKIEAALKLNSKLLSRSPPHAPLTESASKHWRIILAIEGNPIENNYRQFHVLSLKNDVLTGPTFPDSNAFIPDNELNVPSDCNDFKWTMNEGTFIYPRVIVDNQIYHAVDNYVNVYAFKSKRPISKIEGILNEAKVHRIFLSKKQLFVVTSNEIYRFNSEANKFCLVLRMDRDFHSPLATVLEHNYERTSFVVREIFLSQEITMYSTGSGNCEEVRPGDIHEVPPCLVLIGCHEGLVYFMSWALQESPFYVAFRDDVEVKRRYLACDRAICRTAFNGLLTCFINIRKTKFLLVVDLTTDRVLFRRPLTDLGLTSLQPIIPIIGECPDLQPNE